MAADLGRRLAIAAAAAALSLAAVVCNGFPATLTLERHFTKDGVDLTHVMARDRARHGRMLSSTTDTVGVVDFPVYGTYDPFLVGLYYTKVKLGDPPKEFYVQIDTGSDALWVSCSSCTGCPTKSNLHIPMNFYNPETSSTASSVSCSSPICIESIESADARCSAMSNLCGFNFLYGDGSTSSGNYVSDTIHLDIVDASSGFGNPSPQVVFGCSTEVTGDLSNSDGSVDGIFGFGQSSISVISQLASQGITPYAFSQCLKGGRKGGGVLVLGEAVEPNMVYSPLVPDQPHYNLDLLSISVDGTDLNINASVFETTINGGGTIIDSGTTLAYLADGAYFPFITAINDVAVSNSAEPIPVKSNTCYATNSSSSDMFPQVSFNFMGGATMTIGPEDYLLQQETTSGDTVLCIGIGPMQGPMTILGDIVLQNKIIVYDLEGQRIGWTNYDCSKRINVETTADNGTNMTVSIGHTNSTPSNAGTVRLWTAMLGLVLNLAVRHFIFQ